MRRHYAVIAVLLGIVGFGLLAVAPAGRASTSGWWNDDWPFRVAVTVDAAGYARQDKVAEVPINFTTLLSAAGNSGAFSADSLRVVEVDGTLVIDDAVPFQFDQATDYDATTNASGTLLILLEGATPADETRTFHVYFGLLGTDYDPALVPSRVSVTSIVDPFGYAAFRLVTDGGTYTFQKTGGGFASLTDSDDRDWISWNDTPEAAGDFRGIPNMVFPTDGGYFHPGRTGVESTLPRSGPLRATIRAATTDGKWVTRWDVFPTYARMTVEKIDPTKAYWFLYEGTPGGTLEPTIDTVTRSDNTTVTAGQSWVGDIPGEEWVYFTDPALSRSMYVIHHDEDDLVDSYRPSGDKLMTVFGFGRETTKRFLKTAPKQFTFGLANETAFAPMTGVVRNAYKPLESLVGSVETRPAGTVTATPLTPTATPVTPTVTPTATATPSATPTASPTAPTPTPEAYRLYLPAVVGP